MAGNSPTFDTSPPRSWPARAATLVVFSANGLGIGTWAASIANLKLSLVLSNGQLSFVLLSFAIGAVIAMPLAGWIGSRVSTARASTIAGLGFVIALSIPAFAPALGSLCAAAAAVGLTNGGLDVLMNAHASIVERRWCAPIMSSFHAAYSVGGMAGALLGGTLAAAGAHAQLGTASVIGAIAIVASSRFLGPGDRAASASPMFKMPDRALLSLGFIALLCMMIEGAVGDWSGTLLSQTGMSVGAAAIGYIAFSSCMVAGRLSGDFIVAQLGHDTILRLGAILAAVGLAITAALPGALPGAVGFGMVGLGLSNIIPAAFSEAGRTGPSPAAGVAATATAGYAGLVFGPVAIGAVATVANLRWGMGVLCVAAILIAMLAGRRTA